jgi:putative membrane protein
MTSWFFFPIAFFSGLFLILVLVSLAFWTVFSGRWRTSSSSHRPDSALQITRERYAKGELTKEQFEQMTKDLCQT